MNNKLEERPTTDNVERKYILFQLFIWCSFIEIRNIYFYILIVNLLIKICYLCVFIFSWILIYRQLQHSVSKSYSPISVDFRDNTQQSFLFFKIKNNC